MIDIRELRIGQTVRFDQGFGTIEGLRSTRYMEWDTGDKTGTVTVGDISGVYYLCDLEEISIPSREEIDGFLKVVDDIRNGFYENE